MSEKRYKQLEQKDREAIEEGLTHKKSVSAIAKEIGVATATVTREIMRNRRDDGYRGVSEKAWGNANRCVNRKRCDITGLHSHCTSPDAKRCSFCKKSKCMGSCDGFEEEICTQIATSPHVCNGCNVGSCRLHRYRYSAKDAQAMAEARSREARCGIDCTPEDLMRSEDIIRAGIKKGQGLDHIFLAHADEIAFAKTTFYRHVRNGDVSTIPLELRKAVKYKARKKNNDAITANIPKEVLEGRTYADFLELDEKMRANVVQCDCVEGPEDENSALLTLHFVSLHFQIALKLTVKNSDHVMRCFKWLLEILGVDFSTYLGILVFDRGCEFTRVAELESFGAKQTRVYFCDPRRSDQKAECEKNHVEIRKVIEKGASLKGIGPWELAEVMSHVNSSLRLSIFGKSPMALALGVLPQALFDNLGYRLIAPDDVMLKPELLNPVRRPS
jgi:IS30 family transposase